MQNDNIPQSDAQPDVESTDQNHTLQTPPSSSLANNPTPVGISASQMGLSPSQSSKSWRALLKPLIITVIVLVVLVGGYVFVKSLSGYSTKSVQSDGFSYSVTYSKISSTVDLNGKPYLEGRDKSGHNMLLYVGKSTQSTYDCHASSGSTISVVATPTIDGNQHNLCYSRLLNAYDMNFTHNGDWYFLTMLPKDKSQSLDQDTLKMIASSIVIQ